MGHCQCTTLPEESTDTQDSNSMDEFNRQRTTLLEGLEKSPAAPPNIERVPDTPDSPTTTYIRGVSPKSAHITTPKPRNYSISNTITATATAVSGVGGGFNHSQNHSRNWSKTWSPANDGISNDAISHSKHTSFTASSPLNFGGSGSGTVIHHRSQSNHACISPHIIAADSNGDNREYQSKHASFSSPRDDTTLPSNHNSRNSHIFNDTNIRMSVTITNDGTNDGINDGINDAITDENKDESNGLLMPPTARIDRRSSVEDWESLDIDDKHIERIADALADELEGDCIIDDILEQPEMEIIDVHLPKRKFTTAEKEESMKSQLRPETVRNIDDIYRSIRILGKGVSCVVGEVEYIGKEYPNKRNKKYALKRLDKNTEWSIDVFQKEIEILKKIGSHPNVIHFEHAYIDSRFYFISTKLCTGGALLERIAQNSKFSERAATDIIRSLLSAVTFLHSIGIVHRDIKPGNLVFDKPGKDGNLVLIDFGDSIEVESETIYTDQVGTPLYLSPESAECRPCKGWEIMKSDVWSCGMVAYIILTGTILYKARTEAAVLDEVKYFTDWQITFPNTSVLSNEAMDWIRCVLRRDTSTRFTAEQALNHPWLNDPTHVSTQVLPTEFFAKIEAFNEANILKKIIVQGLLESMTTREKQLMVKMFRAIDKQDKGWVDVKEIEHWLLHSGFSSHEATKRATQMVRSMSSEGNDSITLKDFTHATGMAKLRQSHHRALSLALGNNVCDDGKMDIPALRRLLSYQLSDGREHMKKSTMEAIDKLPMDEKGQVDVDVFIQAIDSRSASSSPMKNDISELEMAFECLPDNMLHRSSPQLHNQTHKRGRLIGKAHPSALPQLDLKGTRVSVPLMENSNSSDESSDELRLSELSIESLISK